MYVWVEEYIVQRAKPSLLHPVRSQGRRESVMAAVKREEVVVGSGQTGPHSHVACAECVGLGSDPNIYD